MTALSAALAWGTVVSPGLSALASGAAIGVAAGLIRAVEAAALPRAFGTLHIGAIRGVIVSISVAGTACGPLLFAAVLDRIGSYGPVLAGSAVAPLLIAVWALVQREPVPVQPSERPALAGSGSPGTPTPSGEACPPRTRA